MFGKRMEELIAQVIGKKITEIKIERKMDPYLPYQATLILDLEDSEPLTILISNDPVSLTTRVALGHGRKNEDFTINSNVVKHLVDA